MAAVPDCTFDGVTVLTVRDFAVIYRIDGQPVTVAPLQIQKGTTAHFASGAAGRPCC